jgi:hypothetical protein
VHLVPYLAICKLSPTHSNRNICPSPSGGLQQPRLPLLPPQKAAPPTLMEHLIADPIGHPSQRGQNACLCPRGRDHHDPTRLGSRRLGGEDYQDGQQWYLFRTILLTAPLVVSLGC